MEDEIVNLEGEGDSKVTIGGLREKACWKHRCCLSSPLQRTRP